MSTYRTFAKLLAATFLVALALIGSSCSSSKPKTPAGPAPLRAVQVSKAELEYASSRLSAPINVHYYGHGFIYITNSVGVRAAIDPFGPATVHYPFPQHIDADFVLISHESEDHDNTNPIFGNPPIFRSVAAEGLNRANGIPFLGVHLQNLNDTVGNTAFVFSFDEVTFAYLGAAVAPLSSIEKSKIGHVDVVFLPVGGLTITPKELDQMVLDVGAQVVIPIDYKTQYTGDLGLRELAEYTAATKFPVVHLGGPEIIISSGTLPGKPVIYCLTPKP